MPRVDVLVDDADRQAVGELAAIGAAGRHEPLRRPGDPDVVRPDRAGAPRTAVQLERVPLLEPHPLAELVDRDLRLERACSAWRRGRPTGRSLSAGHPAAESVRRIDSRQQTSSEARSNCWIVSSRSVYRMIAVTPCPWLGARSRLSIAVNARSPR